MADKADMKESLRAFGFEDAVIDQALTRCSSIESAAEFIISGGVEAMKIRHEEEKHEVRSNLLPSSAPSSPGLALCPQRSNNRVRAEPCFFTLPTSLPLGYNTPVGLPR